MSDPSTITPRAVLAAFLTAECPDDWAIIDTQRTVQTIDQITVLLKQQKISRPARAPGVFQVDWVITIVSPYTDPDNAEQDLDDCVFVLLGVLDPATNIAWSEAEKKTFQDAYFCYDVTATSYTDSITAGELT